MQHTNAQAATDSATWLCHPLMLCCGSVFGARCFIDVHKHTLEVVFLLVIPVWSVFLGCAFLYWR